MGRSRECASGATYTMSCSESESTRSVVTRRLLPPARAPGAAEAAALLGAALGEGAGGLQQGGWEARGVGRVEGGGEPVAVRRAVLSKSAHCLRTSTHSQSLSISGTQA